MCKNDDEGHVPVIAFTALHACIMYGLDSAVILTWMILPWRQARVEDQSG